MDIKSIHFKTLLTLIIICYYSTGIAQQTEKYSLPTGATENDYISNTVIFKIKSTLRDKCGRNSISDKQITTIISRLGKKSLSKKFPNAAPPLSKSGGTSQTFADLSLIYELTYSISTGIDKAINDLYATGHIEYAVPHFIAQPAAATNDPFLSNQYYINTVKATQAWAISKGDTNIVIGIVDTGTDLDHPDLIENISYNYNDPVDNTDNDNDGYTDNFNGWNLGENNNTPQTKASFHGTHVSGIAAASTNNGTGIAGIGNKCRFLPVKVDNAQGIMTMAYEGIVYAADHGSSIINCSWYSRFSSGQYGQDIINYAVNNKNAAVIASAGDNNSENPVYPAAYKNVLSIAATTSKDAKLGISGYGNYISLCAPGDAIYSTWDGGSYINSSGTSMSAAVVSGCAAILKSVFPALSSHQLCERLRVTADNIDGIASNKDYIGKLGSGRVNLQRAITETTMPSVRVTSYTSSVKNDLMTINAGFRNYLSNTKKLKISITSESKYIKLLDSVFSPGIIKTLKDTNNNKTPFRIQLHPGMPQNYSLTLRLNYIDTLYKDFQYLTFILKKDYITIDTGNVALTITPNSRVGFNDSDMMHGTGFTYKDSPSLISCGGLVVGNSAGNIADNIYGITGTFDTHFTSLRKPIRVINPKTADFEVTSAFADTVPEITGLKLAVSFHGYAWKNPPDDKYIILEYYVKNTGTTDLTNVYIGFFADWEIHNRQRNRVSYDPDSRMSYAFDIDGGTYCGTKLLSTTPVRHYGIDNDGTNGSVRIDDGFTYNEKYQALRIMRNDAGTSPNGNNISDMLSTGPFNINRGDSVKAVFAIIAGDHVGDLQSSALSADKRYNQHEDVKDISDAKTADLSDNFPNPCSSYTNISVYMRETAYAELSIYNLLGRKVKTIANTVLPNGRHNFHVVTTDLEDGIYYYRLKYNEIQTSLKLIKMGN